MYSPLFVITTLSSYLYLLLRVCQATQLTHILNGRVKELVEDAEREKALKDAMKVASKERVKITATAEKKAVAFEKAKALAEKRLANLEAKVGETELKLAEAKIMNTAQAEELANLRAALEGCGSKWYNEGLADAEKSMEPIINEARKMAFKEGWFVALQAVKVPKDSPLKDPNQIPLPSLPTAAQKTLVVVDEEETISLRELVEQIDAHAEQIDLEATNNLNAKDQHSGNIQLPPEAQYAPVDAAQI